MSAHYSHYAKKVTFLGLRAWWLIFLLLSMLRPFSWLQHMVLLVVMAMLYYIEKKRGYVPEYYLARLRVILGGHVRGS